MGKVKKAGAGRSTRTKAPNGRPKKSAKKARRAGKTVGKKAKKAKKAKPARSAKPIKAAKAAPVSSFALHLLDPVRKCGAGTSVQRLYRVDESSTDGSARVHLVFFDRHGWYCEHGRDCAAVSYARKHDDGV